MPLHLSNSSGAMSSEFHGLILQQLRHGIMLSRCRCSLFRVSTRHMHSGTVTVYVTAPTEMRIDIDVGPAGLSLGLYYRVKRSSTGTAFKWHGTNAVPSSCSP